MSKMTLVKIVLVAALVATCVEASSNCLVSNSTSGVCIRCENSFFVNTTTNACEPVTIPDCLMQYSSTVCSQCTLGTFQVQAPIGNNKGWSVTCRKAQPLTGCIQHVIDGVTNQTLCTQCDSSYTLVEQRQYTYRGICKAKFGNIAVAYNGVPIQCDAGFERTTTKCKPCPAGCSSCYNGVCYGCLPGLFMVNKTCTGVCHSSCKTCNSTSASSCYSCNTGLAWNNFQCIADASGCGRYYNGTCQQCQLNYASANSFQSQFSDMAGSRSGKQSITCVKHQDEACSSVISETDSGQKNVCLQCRYLISADRYAITPVDSTYRCPANYAVAKTQAIANETSAQPSQWTTSNSASILATFAVAIAALIVRQ